MINQLIKIVVLFLCLMPCVSMAEGRFHTFNVSYTVKSSTRVISVGLVLVDLEKYREILPDTLTYNQILSYSKEKSFEDIHGRSTSAHETVHGINSELRNSYKKLLKKNVNGFYAGDGKGIVVLNPSIHMRDIVPYIPTILRGYRYNLYFVKQLGHWDDVPTYPIDEWSAYIAGAESAVDDSEMGIGTEKSDCVSGALEFGIYCTALALAVKNNDTEYWDKNIQFKNAIQYYLIKSERIFFKGQEKFPFAEQDKLLEHLRNHKDAKELREFLLKEFQGIFVD